MVYAQKHRDAEEIKFQLLKDPSVKPPVTGVPVQPPPGLDYARQEYLFTKLREYCADDAKDITCPTPVHNPNQPTAPQPPKKTTSTAPKKNTWGPRPPAAPKNKRARF